MMQQEPEISQVAPQVQQKQQEPAVAPKVQSQPQKQSSSQQQQQFKKSPPPQTPKPDEETFFDKFFKEVYELFFPPGVSYDATSTQDYIQDVFENGYLAKQQCKLLLSILRQCDERHLENRNMTIHTNFLQAYWQLIEQNSFKNTELYTLAERAAQITNSFESDLTLNQVFVAPFANNQQHSQNQQFQNTLADSLENYASGFIEQELRYNHQFDALSLREKLHYICIADGNLAPILYDKILYCLKYQSLQYKIIPMLQDFCKSFQNFINNKNQNNSGEAAAAENTRRRRSELVLFMTQETFKFLTTFNQLYKEEYEKMEKSRLAQQQKQQKRPSQQQQEKNAKEAVQKVASPETIVEIVPEKFVQQ